MPRAVASTTDPGGPTVLPARRAGVPHYQDCDSTRSPIDAATPAPELDESRLHRLAVMSPHSFEQLNEDAKSILEAATKLPPEVEKKAKAKN